MAAEIVLKKSEHWFDFVWTKFPRHQGYGVVRGVLGIVLLVASFLKIYYWISEPVAKAGLFSSRWFTALEIECELALAVWLLSGLYQYGAWYITTLCFIGFSFVTLYKGLLGESSCGCFGKIQVNPWYTLIFDLVSIFVLIYFRPLKGVFFTRPNWAKMGLTVFVYSILGFPTGYMMVTSAPSTLTSDGKINGQTSFVVVEPDKWTGKYFPLLKHIDIGDELARGNYTLLFYHYDCPDCRSAILRCEKLTREYSKKIVLVEVPPYANSATFLSVSCLSGKLSETINWFIPTPMVISLENGYAKSSPLNAFILGKEVKFYGNLK
jgi:hypothetical protein